MEEAKAAIKITEVYKLKEELLELEKQSANGDLEESTEQEQVDHIVQITSKIKRVRLLKEEINSSLRVKEHQ